MRPEVIAFRELEIIVRRLSDQLAAYRQRALKSESRVRDLETSLERSVEKGETALLAARAETAAVRRLLEENTRVVTLQMESANAKSGSVRDSGGDSDLFSGPDVEAPAPAPLPVLDSEALSNYGDIAVENERLRARLGEAHERTVVLVERVRFLRQQLMQPAER